MGILNLFRSKQNTDHDQLVLVQLRKSGSDLSKPHKIEFFLYFPTQSIAENAGLNIRDAGFEVEVRGAAQGNCLVVFRHKDDGSNVIGPAQNSPGLHGVSRFHEWGI